jgi:hypothetical protein
MRLTHAFLSPALVQVLQAGLLHSTCNGNDLINCVNRPSAVWLQALAIARPPHYLLLC